MTEVRRHRAAILKQAPSTPKKKKKKSWHSQYLNTTLNPLHSNTHVVVNNQSWCIGGLAIVFQIESPNVELLSTSISDN